jgi:hypothetical protein
MIKKSVDEDANQGARSKARKEARTMGGGRATAETRALLIIAEHPVLEVDFSVDSRR